jgi:multidrug efflux system membrane fusion protein
LAKKKLIKGILPILILIAGFGVIALMGSKPEAKRKPPVGEKATLVRLSTLRAGPQALSIQGEGVVAAAHTAKLSAPVSGTVVWLSPKLRLGGRFVAGAPVLRLDARDYQARLDQAKAGVARAHVEVRRVVGQGRVAAAEWRGAIADRAEAIDEALALKKPQLAAARAGVASAAATLRLAELALERTVLRAPFDCSVRSHSVALGDLVGPARPVAEVHSIERAEVTVSLSAERLALLAVDGDHPATVLQRLGDTDVRWSGRLLRVVGELDPRSRMARVVVGVDNPFPASGGRLPLLIGSFVSVTLEGAQIEGAFRIPAAALQPDNSVWLMNPAGRLERREVEVAYRQGEGAVIRSGLKDGERLVLNKLGAPIAGMLLDPVDAEAPVEVAKKASEAGR